MRYPIRFIQIVVLCLMAGSANIAWSKGEVTQINTHTDTSSASFSYSVDGTTYNWQGEDLIIDSFEYDGTTYNYTNMADRVVIRRVDNAQTSGERCTMFVEATPDSDSTTLVSSFPRLSSSNNCDLAGLMGGNVINRGALDVFNNGGDGRIYSAKNIERVDFIFSGGVIAPLDSDDLSKSGITATEKSGNNDVLVAAILSLDANGDPASYSKPVRIYRKYTGTSSKYAYGMTNISYHLTRLVNDLSPPQDYPYMEPGGFSETLGMVFVDLEALDIDAGDVWYGFSYFSPDVANDSLNSKGQVNWLGGIDPVDYTTFPTDTDHSYDYGDADIYGGAGGYFVDEDFYSISGTAYRDENKNGVQDVDEQGIPDIGITVYLDANTNGTVDASDTALPAIETDGNGDYSVASLSNGQYIVRINGSDSDVPTGYQLSITADQTVTISNANAGNIDYPFISGGSTESYTVVGEYWFDDCGNGEWVKDYSSTKNNATGSPAIKHTDYKDYACNAIENNSWNAEIPDHAAYDITDGALSILLYDHHNVWSTTRLIDKGYWLNPSKKLALEIKRVDGDRDKGTITAYLNGNIIATGETFFTTYGGGDDDTQWIHILFSFGSQGMKLYINGDLKGTHAYTGGIDGIPSDIAMPAVSGYFDEFYILEGQPTDTEVTSIYNNLIANKNLDGSIRTCDCPGHKLEIVKTADKENVETGDTIVFTITVTNNSIITDATGVKVSDLLESTVTYVSDDSGGNYNASTGVWNIGRIDTGDSEVLKITATVN